MTVVWCRHGCGLGVDPDVWPEALSADGTYTCGLPHPEAPDRNSIELTLKITPEVLAKVRGLEGDVSEQRRAMEIAMAEMRKQVDAMIGPKLPRCPHDCTAGCYATPCALGSEAPSDPIARFRGTMGRVEGRSPC